MKRRFLFRCALSAAAVCMMTVCGASAALSEEGAAAYKGVIDSLAGQYGSAHAEADGIYRGLSCAELIDFDGDGTPELYCAYGTAEGQVRQVLYTYDNGLVQLTIPERVSNFGTDVSPTVLLYTGAGKAYLADGQEVANGGEVRYLTKQGREMASALSYVRPEGEESPACKLNGEDASAEEIDRALAALTEGMTATEYSFVRADGDGPTATIETTLDELGTSSTLDADPAIAHLQVKYTRNGQQRQGRIDVAAYGIEGSLYVKLRDIAAAINGTERQFAIGWDGGSSSIRISTGRHYVLTGEELGELPTAPAKAVRAEEALLVDGVSKSPATYLIGQNHYYRLRDLAGLLGLGIDWDANTKTVLLEPAD